MAFHGTSTQSVLARGPTCFFITNPIFIRCIHVPNSMSPCSAVPWAPSANFSCSVPCLAQRPLRESAVCCAFSCLACPSCPCPCPHPWSLPETSSVSKCELTAALAPSHMYSSWWQLREVTLAPRGDSDALAPTRQTLRSAARRLRAGAGVKHARTRPSGTWPLLAGAAEAPMQGWIH